MEYYFDPKAHFYASTIDLQDEDQKEEPQIHRMSEN